MPHISPVSRLRAWVSAKGIISYQLASSGGISARESAALEIAGNPYSENSLTIPVAPFACLIKRIFRQSVTLFQTQT